QPEDMQGIARHGSREAGDLGHIDSTKPAPKLLIGSENWVGSALAEIELMTWEGYAAELVDLDRRNRRKDLSRRGKEGPRSPWRASRHGPMRELILTANKEWFAQGDDGDVSRQEQFETLAVDWLREHFGDDVIHARADLDEQAYHIHAVIMPRAVVKKYGTDCMMLQPSIHPMIKNYEAAQDSVGEWFSEVGLVRGERRKQAIREALQNGEEPPVNPRHVRPAEWRRKEELRLAREAELQEEYAKKLAKEDARQKEVENELQKRVQAYKAQVKRLKAHEAALAKRDETVTTHEAELATRETKVTEREAEASEAKAEADTVIAFAEAVASGEIDEAGQPVGSPKIGATPSVEPPYRKSRRGFERAKAAFSRAVARGVSAARKEVDDDLKKISGLYELFVELVKELPTQQRMKIAEKAKPFISRFTGLILHHAKRDERGVGRGRGDGR
ncbi:MAG: Pre (Mob) type recombination enzyme, partial [Maritimibacter sp.]